MRLKLIVLAILRLIPRSRFFDGRLSVDGWLQSEWCFRHKPNRMLNIESTSNRTHTELNVRRKCKTRSLYTDVTPFSTWVSSSAWSRVLPHQMDYREESICWLTWPGSVPEHALRVWTQPWPSKRWNWKWLLSRNLLRYGLGAEWTFSRVSWSGLRAEIGWAVFVCILIISYIPIVGPN